MKKKLRKAIAVLVIAANMVGLCAPAYAEETNTAAEEMFTVTEDEQGMVTIEFNEPIVLTREESYAEDGAEEDGGIMPCATMSTDAIDSAYWGTYISEDYNYYISIRGATDVTIRIVYPGYGDCLCSGADISSLYFDPAKSKSDNFEAEYSKYIKVNSTTQNELVNNTAKIGGRYYSGKYFTINKISLYKA